MTNVFTADALTRLSQLGPPQTIADVAALSALGVASAAYLLRGIAWDRPDPYHHLWFERMGSKNGAASGPKATRDIAKKLEETVSPTCTKTQSSHLYVLGQRCCHLLGFSIWNCRNVRQQTLKRMSSSLRSSNSLR